MARRLALIVTAALVVLLCTTVNAQMANSVWIGPFGSDTNGSGTSASPYLTMSKGVASVNPGGTVYVLPGVYTGSINFPRITKTVNITADPSVDSPSQAYFSGQGRSGVVGFSFDPSVKVTFYGVGFADFAYNSNFGAVYSTGTVNFNKCAFWSNDLALAVSNNSATLTDVTFVNNGKAMAFPYSDFPPAKVSILASRVTVTGGGLGVSVDTGYAEFQGDTLTFENVGSAVSVSVQNHPFYINISDSRFFNCTSSAVWAYGLPNASSPQGRIVVTKSTFSSNGGTNVDGGAVYVGDNVDAAFDSCTFINNRALASGSSRGHGGTFFCDQYGSINVSQSLVNGSQATDGGAGWCDPKCAFVANGVTVTGTVQVKNTSPCTGL